MQVNESCRSGSGYVNCIRMRSAAVRKDYGERLLEDGMGLYTFEWGREAEDFPLRIHRIRGLCD